MKDTCIRLLSQFLYPLILAIIILVCSFCKPIHRYTIPISETTTFDDQKDPIYIVHMTDLHISDSYPKAVQNSNDSFHYINQYIKPDFLVITGDITDNYVSSKRPCKSVQIDSQFEMYHKMLKASGAFDYAFETIGNHDVVGISKRLNDEKKTNYHKFFNVNETTVSTAKINRNFRIISFNPVEFASGTGLMGLAKKIDKKNLGKLEEVINKNCDQNFVTVVASHFTTTTLYPQLKTSSGKTFNDLLKKCNIKYFLNGHIHPKKPKTYHHKSGFIEITGIPSKLNEGFAVFSVDNGHSNYQMVNTSCDRPAVLTFPPASVFENVVLKEFNGFVRIVSFSNNANQFRATVENTRTKQKVSCDLHFERYISYYDSDEINRPRLFQCSLSKSEFDYRGVNKLTVEGDLSQTTEFNVNEPLKVSEQHNVLFVSYGFVVGITFALAYHVVLLGSIFVPLEFEYFRNYKNHPIFSILAGPAVTGYRLKKLDLWAKISLPILVFLPYFLPVGFFPSGEDNGVITFWGFSIHNEFTFDIFLIGLGCLYFFTVAISIEEIFIIVLTKWTMSYVVDLIVAVVLYAIALFMWYYFGIEVSYGARFIASFSFIIFPIVSIILAAIYRPLKIRMRINSSEENDNIDSVLNSKEQM